MLTDCAPRGAGGPPRGAGSAGGPAVSRPRRPGRLVAGFRTGARRFFGVGAVGTVARGFGAAGAAVLARGFAAGRAAWPVRVFGTGGAAVGAPGFAAPGGLLLALWRAPFTGGSGGGKGVDFHRTKRSQGPPER